MKNVVWRQCVLVCLLALAPGLARAIDSVQAKAGADYAQRLQDQNYCFTVAQRAPVQDLPPPASAPALTRPAPPLGFTYIPTPSGFGPGLSPAAGVGSAGLGLFAVAAIGEMQDGLARERARQLCMKNLGYVNLPLTKEESRGATTISEVARANWQLKFLNQDLSSRIAALPPPAAPLPPYREEPTGMGGVRLDPASIRLASGPISEGAVIVSGKVTRLDTAVLATDFQTPKGLVTIAGKSGSIFHQIDTRSQSEPLLRPFGPTWCGPVEETNSKGVTTQVYCLTSRENGYDVYRPTGSTWLAGPYFNGEILKRFKGKVDLKERAVDDLGPLDFSIKVGQVNARGAVLTAEVRRGEESVTIWSLPLTYEKTGRATVPLGGRNLIFSKVSDTSLRGDLDPGA